MAALVLALPLLMPTSAQAALVSFECITNNAGQACETWENQFLVDVTVSGNQATFKFTNSATVGSSITEIYFDENNPNLSLTYLPGASSEVGADFDLSNATAGPGTFPGGNPIGFSVTNDVTAEPPRSQNGINAAGDYVSLVFALGAGQTAANLAAAIIDGTLRLGLHVQAFPGEFSESFVNNPPPTGTPFDLDPIPEPASLLLLGSGLAGLAAARKRRAAAGKS